MHNRKKYLLRLFVFAIISHFAYCFAFGINFIPFSTGTFFNQTSIMWSLALGLTGIMIQDSKIKNIWKTIITLLLCVLGFPSDWSSVAVMIVIYNYVYRNNFKKQMISQTIFSGIYSLVYCFFINIWYGLIQLATIIKIQWWKRKMERNEILFLFYISSTFDYLWNNKNIFTW